MDFIYETKLYQHFRGLLICLIDLLITGFSYVFVFLWITVSFWKEGFFILLD